MTAPARSKNPGSGTARFPRARAAHLALAAGVTLAAFGTPATMLLLGGNAFGPPKAFVLALATAVTALGMALAPDAPAALGRALRSSWVALAAIALAAAAVVTAIPGGRLREAFLGSYPDYRGVLLALACLVVGAGAYVYADGRFRPRTARPAVVALAWMSAVAVGERIGLPPAGLKLEGAVRAISTAGNASNLGVVLVMLVPLALLCALRDDRPAWRLAAAIASLGGIVALSWTLSRGAWIAAAVALALVTFVALPVARRTQRAWSDRRALVWALAVLVTLGVAIAVVPQTASRAARILDTESATARWRLSAWRSSVEIVSDNALTGVGANGFASVYPAYKEPGQDDGRLGYARTESAHNLLLDTAVSFGVGGLAALAGLAIALAAVLGGALRGPDDPRRAETLALGAALLGGFIALQFHYVTLDTAPLMAALIGLVAAREAGSAASSGRDSARSKAAGWWAFQGMFALVALAFVVAAAGSAQVLRADALLGRATALARQGGTWGAIRPLAEKACGTAGWEPAVLQKAGKLAGSYARSGDADAASEAVAAYEAAIRLSPSDPVLRYELGAVTLMASLAVDDPALLGIAEDSLRRAAELDPNSGLPKAALGRAALARGDASRAVTLLEESVTLSPDSSASWRDLSRAYAEIGDSAAAATAAGNAEASGNDRR